MPDKMSREKIDLLRAYGAEVVVAPTDVAPGFAAVLLPRRRPADASEIPGAFQPNQYANPANPETHYDSTGPGAVAPDRRRGSRTSSSGVGTGGTITGIGALPEGAEPRRSR